MEKDLKRTGIIILGMHRSGTSALTRAMSLLGFGLPSDVTGKSDSNITGHWESASIVALNDAILHELGLGWDSWYELKLEALAIDKKQQFIDGFEDNIKAIFADQQDFILKDPRLCRTAPLLLRALHNLEIEPKIIIPLRNPLEVADSLQARNHFAKAKSALIWLTYVVEAEAASRDYKRAFLFYEDLLQKPVATLNDVLNTLGLSPAAAMDDVESELTRFLKPKLRHHEYFQDDITLDAIMRHWVRNVYTAMSELKKDPYSRQALAALDRVRAELRQSLPVFENIHSALIEDHAAELDQLSVELQERVNTIAERDKLIENRQAAVDQLSVELQERVNTIAERDKLIENRQAAVDKLSVELQDCVHDLDVIRAQAAKFQDQISELAGTLLQREADIRDNAVQIETLFSHVEERDQRLNMQAAQSVVLEAKLQETQSALQATEGTLQETQSALQETQSALHVQTDLARKTQNEITAIKLVNERLIYEAEHQKAHLADVRAQLVKEQQTVIKPALRRIRRFTGKSLRLFLPDKFVNRLAFLVPTAEQRLILDIKEREKLTANALVSVDHVKTVSRSKTPDIFIFAIIGWHFRTQRPQHIARQLTQLGYRVFYFEMDPPEAGSEIEKIDDRLFRIKLMPEDAAPIPAYVGQPSAQQERGWLRAFYDFCDQVDATPHKITIIQHPFWWQFARLLPPEHWILYDCMDDISGFENTNPELLRLEHDLLEQSDHIVVSASNLMKKHAAYNPVQIIRNATEIDHFEHFSPDVLEEKFRLKTLSDTSAKAIKIGYVGAIADWFDTELLLAVAKNRPDVEFHLCGHVSADHPQKLAKEANIHLYGEIPYAQVPAFLDQMDIVTIPFKINPIIQACDPVKFYEYSALGKPTITTPLPELERVYDIAFVAKNASDYSKAIEKALAEGQKETFRQALKDFARQNTWAHRAQQFADTFVECHPKVSIVILAYGDPALTNTTLSSLKERGDHYPNMEIIIVDNGSPEADLNQMKQYAAQFTGVRFIENGENLGFAAGNNVGIKAATGEFVMLLNNDTFVSPGAVYGMMRHLQNNPSAGVVGALTNNIGNEAKLDIQYSTMAEMIHRSRALKTGYRSKAFEVAVTAYFAVMFRKKDLDMFGLLSTDYGRGMFEDDDHCKVIQSKGYSSIVAEDVFIHHHLSATFSKLKQTERDALFAANKAVFEKKWGPWQAHQYRDSRLPSCLQFSHEDLY